MDAIIADSVISNSTALNLRERGPIIAAMGISSFLTDIMNNRAPEYLDFMGSMSIRGTTFLPISATGVMQLYPNNLLTVSEVQSANGIFSKMANSNNVSPIETAHDHFIAGNEPTIGTGHSSSVETKKEVKHSNIATLIVIVIFL